MTRLLRRASLRYLRHHPWQLGLAVLGIALGVGVAVAVQLLQLSVRSAFDLSMNTLQGAATHVIRHRAGETFEETLYFSLVSQHPELQASPILHRAVVTATPPRYPLQLLGFDPLSRRMPHPASLPRAVPGILITRPGSALITAGTAARLGLVEPGPIVLQAAHDKVLELDIAALIDTAGGSTALTDDVVIVDIATAQETLALGGQLTGIELYGLAPHAAIIATIEAQLPNALEIADLGASRHGGRELTRAFDTNLTALSLLAVITGLFLIYNTATFLVLQRHTVIGRLRALGVSRREVFTLLMFEALALGAIGALCGVVLGTVLATAMLESVATTVNDLYFQAIISDVRIDTVMLCSAVLSGMLGTCIAALGPAWEATRVPVIGAILDQPRPLVGTQLARRCLALAVLLLALAPLALAISEVHLVTSFIAFLLALLGAALCLPSIITVLTRPPHAARVPRIGNALYVGLRTVRLSLGRSAIAAAALMVAAATSIAMGVMIASFRAAVDDWLRTSLRADLYVTPSGDFARSELPAIKNNLLNHDGIAAISTVTRTTLSDGTDKIRLNAFELPARARAGFVFIHGDATTIWSRWQNNDCIIVTEPFAYHRRLALNDTLSLATKRGAHQFSIIGIYRDYASERGSVSMSLATFRRHWDERPPAGIGVYANANTDTTTLRTHVAAELPRPDHFYLRSANTVRQESLAIFDRTFRVTELLRTLAMLIALIGVVGALLAQQLEHARQYGILRALGFYDHEIIATVIMQTLLIGVAAASVAIPIGVALAYLLIAFINVRAFGWTMQIAIPAFELLQAWLLVVAAAVLAGLYPAWRAIRRAPAPVLRYE